MKPMLTSLAAGSLLALVAAAQTPRYTVTDLGNVGADGQPFQTTNNGLDVGSAMVGNALHAVAWYQGQMYDLGTLKGENSQAFGTNMLDQPGYRPGLVVGEAQTSKPDPDGEDFCSFTALGLLPSGSCLPFLWRNGVMYALPTLGGNNGIANKINYADEIAGTAENTMYDATCPSGMIQHQFLPVVWQFAVPHQLPTYPGDPDGSAMAINDGGQAAGASGTCAPSSPISAINLQPLHALLWENGTATDLGNLGGTGQFFGIEAEYLNNAGQVVGWSDLKGDANFHAFLWTKGTGMQDLGTVGSDVNSLAIGINDAGDVVGASLDANFNPRAFLRVGQNLLDLNDLLPAGSPLYLLTACSINRARQITGIAIDLAGNIHAYLATPVRDADSGASMWAVAPAPGSANARRPQLPRFQIGKR
ncbi:MAG TPA: hypothetical protein VME43_04700 [Bryobacteraceae bacterium]|nr:hypothetical protein [Bryobacteraceae bacterium]